MDGEAPDRAALVVRAGQQAALAPEFESMGLVAVGWPLLDDLSGVTDREQLRRVLEEGHATSQVNQSVVELGNFLFDIAPGSTVVSYNNQERYYLVGEVVGPYEYRPDLGLRTQTEPFKHVRRVDWRRGANRADLSEATRKKFPPYKTTFWLDADALAEVEGAGAAVTRRYWWVNQGTTYKTAKAGGYLWAPKKNKAGTTFQHWADLANAAPGDVVFNYANGAIRAMSRVVESASTSPRPDNLEEGGWEVDGNKLSIEYTELAEPLSLSEIPADLRATGPGPFTIDGGVKQGYFFPLQVDVGQALERLAHMRGPVVSAAINVWAFLANPRYWNLKEQVQSKHAGDPEEWTASREKIREDARAGDPVVLYQCGEDAGIYALAQITGPPFKRAEVIADDANRGGWAFPLRYTRILNSPVTKEELLAHPILKDLAVIHGQGSNFRVTPQQWEALRPLLADSEPSPWDEFCYWAGMEIARPDFDAEERTYKIEIAERISAARSRLLDSDPEWLPLLKKAFGPPSNLTSWQVHSGFLDWCAANRALAEEALRAIWSADATDEVRISAFVEAIPDEVKSARRVMILAFLLMALGPESHPPYRTGPFEAAYRLTQYPSPASGLDRSGEYAHVVRFLDTIVAECAKRGVGLRDRLDAQSVLWAIVRNDPCEHWDADTKRRFLAYRGDVIPEDQMIDAQTVYDELCSPDMPIRFPEWIVSDYLLALAAKPFVLLSGISGTGKTQIAQVVAKLLAGDEEVSEAVPVERDEAGAVYHQVGRSTLSYGLVIPADKEGLFMALEPGPSTPVAVDTGSIRLDAFLGRVAFTGGRQPVLRLMWRKPTLEWIRKAAQLGDVLKITPDAHDETVLRVEVITPAKTVTKTDARRVAFVPVRADWTDNRDLLGFYNVLTEQYEATDLLRVLLRAVDAPDRLHFVILDEMNLAKVEYYFADFLSAMETAEHGQGIPLHDHDDEVVIEMDGAERRVPHRLPIPGNVFFTGTVNIDETTHMFSRKVLDRANVIEFHDVDVRRHIGLPSAGLAGPKLRLRTDADVAKLLVQERDRERERAVLNSDLGRRVAAIHDILKDYNLHFGYRVVDECARYLLLTQGFAGEAALGDALDLQVLQKVLPKLAGNRSELQAPLERLLGYFMTGGDSDLELGSLEAVRDLDLSTAELPLSAAKVKRMLERLLAVGFTSFVE